MKFSYQLSKKAEKDLRKMQGLIEERILQKLDFFCEQENPFKFAKKLRGFENYFWFRVSGFRVIFTPKLNGELLILLILKIAPHDEIYDF